LNLWHAALLGLVEGITEYLPVSANGHVIILGTLLHLDPVVTRSFGVVLQAAPMLAVLFLYRRRFEALVVPSVAPGSFRGGRALQLLALGALPVLVTGFLFKKAFYGLMLDSWPSVLGLALGGVGILWAEGRHREDKAASLETITAWQAFGVGLFQCLALWPGVSRSGATIIGALVLGFNRRAAAEFSFLIGVPAFAAAAALELHKGGIPGHDLQAFGLAFALSLTCAIITVKFFMAALGRISFKPFGWYRLALSPLLYFFFG
jgi:undecaprenyl-diphosphatase